MSTQTVSPPALFRRPLSTVLMLSTPIPPANPHLYTGTMLFSACVHSCGPPQGKARCHVLRPLARALA